MSSVPEFLNETLYAEWGQRFQQTKTLFSFDTGFQKLVIFENPLFGRVMALDGVIQTTEKDEFVYHEMLTHVPILAHGKVTDVLVIGGGDGGIVREVLRHKNIKHVTMVEIDPAVVEMSKKHLPNHSAGAFEDPRLKLEYMDGAKFVAETEKRYDVIITDSTDPIGPGEALFTHDYYAQCKRCLKDGGVLVTQNGVGFMQLSETQDTYRRQSPIFKDAGFYVAAVPTYVGGNMHLAWATDNATLRTQPVEEIRQRFQAAGFKTRYYTPEVHVAAFALPQYVLDALKEVELAAAA
ncbi:MAG: polyamine aminopropyltransferase [Alphaproteobacteria bacterium]|nr:polyamine aminopropyltransferase [Alphaproteobacteria bacterium]